MKENPEIIECPCYHVCATLGIETGQWCRYHKGDVPPPGMFRFNPKEHWCPSGVQANVLMLGYMLAGGEDSSEQLQPALERVRKWAQELREQPLGYKPVG